MKKWIALLVVVALVGGGWMYARTLRVTMPWNQPKIAKVSRGDIKVPVTSPGLIEPKQKIEVKSKASGEIVQIRVKPGDYVKSGDVLIKLDPIDEQRNLDRFTAAKTLTEVSLENAKVAVDKARQAQKNAEAQLEQLQAEAPMVRKDFDQAQELKKGGSYSEMDVLAKEFAYKRNLANQKAAEAAVEQSRLAIIEAENFVKQQEETLKKAEADLGDAKRRVSYTTITAPVDALVTEVPVRVGEKIQSGTESFTGGTKLMTLADMSELKVIAKVDEADYGKIVDIAPVETLPDLEYRHRLAQAEADTLQSRSGVVKLRVEAYRDELFEGRIERVEPQGKLPVGASVMQFDVHVTITGENRYKLPLGAQAQVEFTVQSVTNALVVPADAVKSFESKQGVWLVLPPAEGETTKGKKFLQCKIGITDGEKTEIIGTVDGSVLAADTEVFTKLPPEPKDKNEQD